jgi:hypothetical protein
MRGRRLEFERPKVDRRVMSLASSTRTDDSQTTASQFDRRNAWFKSESVVMQSV